jgi:hypothetical protein
MDQRARERGHVLEDDARPWGSQSPPCVCLMGACEIDWIWIISCALVGSLYLMCRGRSVGLCSASLLAKRSEGCEKVGTVPRSYQLLAWIVIARSVLGSCPWCRSPTAHSAQLTLACACNLAASMPCIETLDQSSPWMSCGMANANREHGMDGDGGDAQDRWHIAPISNMTSRSHLGYNAIP